MKQLEETLVEEFDLDPEVITEFLENRQSDNESLSDFLLQKKKIDEEVLLKAYSSLSGMDVVLELPQEPEPFFTDMVPISFLKKNIMIPVATPEGTFIAISDPGCLQQLDDLKKLLQWDGVKVVLSPRDEIVQAINIVYDMGSKDVADRVMRDIDDEDPETILSAIEETADLLDDTSDAPVIKLVNLMLSQAVRDGASDIHIEPYKDKVKIRKRVDGILYDMYSPPKHVQSKLVSRVKIMAKMDIAEKRIPQDGRIEIKIGDKNIDLRVSTLPTSYGERVVMRLLDKSSVLLSLETVGMGQRDLERFNKLIKASFGIILVTGPTGSGKTTTLYSALSVLNQPGVNIITVEDPIEYQIDGISQVQVSNKVGLTFAKGLRTIVRQDPDIILVGEIRDLETAEIAIQSALTGHLVFSTLHTNDSASAITRLIDMGVEPFLISSSVNAILAQRLVRKICVHCREPYKPDPLYLQRVGLKVSKLNGRPFYSGKGCPECMGTGYKGRLGIFELLVMTDMVKSFMLKTSDSGQIKQLALSSDSYMRTLRQDGLNKVLQGLTTLEEVLRVT